MDRGATAKAPERYPLAMMGNLNTHRLLNCLHGYISESQQHRFPTQDCSLAARLASSSHWLPTAIRQISRLLGSGVRNPAYHPVQRRMAVQASSVNGSPLWLSLAVSSNYPFREKSWSVQSFIRSSLLEHKFPPCCLASARVGKCSVPCHHNL